MLTIFNCTEFGVVVNVGFTTPAGGAGLVLLTYARPAGNVSLRTRPYAVPTVAPVALDTTMWKVAEPVAAEALPTVLATLTDGSMTVTTALALVTVGAG